MEQHQGKVCQVERETLLPDVRSAEVLGEGSPGRRGFIIKTGVDVAERSTGGGGLEAGGERRLGRKSDIETDLLAITSKGRSALEG